MSTLNRFVRFRRGGGTAYGLCGDAPDDNCQIQELQGGLFDAIHPTGQVHLLKETELLTPCEPKNIFAVGLNYRSHLGDRKVPENPEIFLKPVSSLQNPGGPIRTPRDSQDMHFEGELVAVIGSGNTVFGVTCGNDVSDRNWQRGPAKDLQWWRAKGCDTFAPLGPAIVTGLDYGNLLLRTRVNGETLQQQRTSDLIFNVETVIRWIGGWVTLQPGDVIYTGTPGNTRRMLPGDVVEVEIEGIGVLRNPVE